MADLSWAEHIDVLNILIGLLFSGVTWFAIRALRLIDRNQTELFRRLNTLEKEFYALKGEHMALGTICKYRRGYSDSVCKEFNENNGG